MKIDKTTPSLPASQIGEVAPRSPNAKPSGGTVSSDTSVNLGTSTAQLRSLNNSVASSSVVDMDKVNAIKQAISEGRFQVNHGAVADRLIDSVKELISANKAGSA
jgi:negative regulator of flagellin synthesis FlgM